MTNKIIRPPELFARSNMIRRCRSPKGTRDFNSYGAKGIKVCKRWLDGENGKTGFQCFVLDLGKRPTKEHTLERIDNDKNYDPTNVRWATKVEQANNRRSSRKVFYRGKELTFAESVRLAGNKTSYTLAWNRHYIHGWSLEESIEIPPRNYGY